MKKQIMNLMKINMNDATVLETTPEGYGRCIAKVSRSGLQDYMGYEVDPDRFAWNSVLKVYRSSAEVGKPESLASFADKPVTISHPWEDVDITNWKEYSVGHLGADAKLVTEDGVDYVEVTIVLQSPEAIAELRAGNKEVSVGYLCNVDTTGGFTPEGVRFDAEQTDIYINHVAIVPMGRAGSLVRILTNDSEQKRSHYFGAIDREHLPIPRVFVQTDSVKPESPTEVKQKDTPMTIQKLMRVSIGDAKIELDADQATLVQTALDAVVNKHVAELADANTAKETALSDANTAHESVVADLKTAHETALSDKETAHTDAVTALTTAHDTDIGKVNAELVTANNTIKDMESKILSPADITALIADRQVILDTAKIFAVELIDAETASNRALKTQVIASQDAEFKATEDTADSTIDAVFGVYAKNAKDIKPLDGSKLDAGGAGGTGAKTPEQIIKDGQAAGRALRQPHLQPTNQGA